MAARIKKYKDVHIEGINSGPSLGMGGEFKCILRDANGRFLYETPWMPNLITDYGIARMNSWLANNGYFFIGNSSQTPAFTDTQLIGYLGASNTQADADFHSTNSAPNWEFYTIKSKRFNAGVGTGTIREVGIGASGAQTNNTMFVRALITPEIEKSLDQVLDVYYRFYIWPDLIDKTGQITVDGELYNWTQRWSDIDAPNKSTYSNASFNTSVAMLAYDGVIGAITGTPAGSLELGGYPSLVTGPAQARDCIAWLSLDQGNTIGATGIRSAVISTTYGPSVRLKMQTNFSRDSDGAGLFKDNTQTMSFEWRISWSRH